MRGCHVDECQVLRARLRCIVRDFQPAKGAGSIEIDRQPACDRAGCVPLRHSVGGGCLVGAIADHRYTETAASSLWTHVAAFRHGCVMAAIAPATSSCRAEYAGSGPRGCHPVFCPRIDHLVTVVWSDCPLERRAPLYGASFLLSAFLRRLLNVAGSRSWRSAGWLRSIPPMSFVL